MSRIPDSFIQELLSRTDIVEIVGARVELKRAGREYKGLSPFTNEKSPSFFVNPSKQMFFDFSSGKNGTAITFLMENDRLSFVEAVEELASRAGLEVPREGGPERLVLDGPLDALAAAERFFRAQLKTHQPAIDYLKKRGLDGETAKLFAVGYAPESWDALAKLFPVAGGQQRHALDAGLLIERESGDGRGGAYDRFRNRVMFPIRDTRGRTIGFGGRTLGNDPAKYLNSPETPLFHKGRNLFGLYEAKQSVKTDLPYLIVVEGYMDVVMLAQHGIRNAVATLGTATTREHLALLFKSTSRVVFSFDGDRAGRSAAWRALEQALPEVHEGRECRFLFLPDGDDPDTLVQEIGAEAFRALVDKALSLSEFLLGELAKQVKLDTLEGRARLAGLAKPHLDKLREGPLRALMIDELGRLTRLSRGDLDAALAGSAKPAAPRPAGETTRAETPGAKPVRRALQLVLECPALGAGAEHLGQLALLSQPGIDLLVDALEFFREHPEANAAQLIERERGTPRGAALERVSRLPMDADDVTAMAAEFRDCLLLLRRRALRERQQALLDSARERSLSPAEQGELLELLEIQKSLAGGAAG